MVAYAKTAVVTTGSDNSNYSPGLRKEYSDFEYEPTQRLVYEVLAPTGGKTVELGNFTTIKQLVIKNKDASQTVRARRQSNVTASNFDEDIPAGGVVVWTDVLISTDLVLTSQGSGNVACDIEISGT